MSKFIYRLLLASTSTHFSLLLLLFLSAAFLPSRPTSFCDHTGLELCIVFFIFVLIIPFFLIQRAALLPVRFKKKDEAPKLACADGRAVPPKHALAL